MCTMEPNASDVASTLVLNWLGVVLLPLPKGLPVSGSFCRILVKVHRGKPLGIGIVLASALAMSGTFGSCAASTFPLPKFLLLPVLAWDNIPEISPFLSRNFSFLIAMWSNIPLTLADHRLLM